MLWSLILAFLTISVAKFGVFLVNQSFDPFLAYLTNIHNSILGKKHCGKKVSKFITLAPELYPLLHELMLNNNRPSFHT
jgi:hypothetical protein